MNLICEEDVSCPWCGEVFPITVDTSQGDYSTIEDCTVCCRPIHFEISAEPGKILSLLVECG